MTGTEFEHIERSTPDLTEENIDKVAALFPDVVTEVESPDGEVVQAIDFDALKAKLGDVAEGPRERYRFTWPGKRAAKAEARMPITKTMRPVPERSKDWDSTQNLYIEGDNLDALKILRETYAGKVKLIYIDPPYNTGHDFIYKDDFHKTIAEDREDNGDFDEEGGRLVANPETNGRFHSDWCSMIYPRLLLMRDLLSSDGSIFISIDDIELPNVRKICDEIFGFENFQTDIIWQKRYTRSNNTINFTTMTEHILVYAKSHDFQVNLLPRDAGADSGYANPDNDPRGPWITSSYVSPVLKSKRPNLCYAITAPDGRVIEHPTNAWKFSQESYEQDVLEERLWWGRDGNAMYPRKKVYLSESRGLTPTNFWSYEYAGSTDQGGKELGALLQSKQLFDFPKPSSLIQRMLEHASSKDSLILDLFSGSGTTAQAVMQQNVLDNGRRRYILVQIPESGSVSGEARQAGYNTICDIAVNRIRRAGEKIKHEIESENIQGSLDGKMKAIPDIGFRVLRIDSSCYEDTRKTPDAYTQGNLEFDVDTTKDDCTPLDLLFECLPMFQIPYSASIEKLDDEVFDGYTVYSVNHGQLVACFDEKIPERVMRGMARLDPKPSYAVVGERSLPDSSARTNFAEIFRQSADALQGQTQIRIL